MALLGTILVIAGVVLAVVILLWAVATRNNFVRTENRIDNAWSQIDVQLQRRADLIPNLVETVKGYARHERETLDSVTQARAALMKAGTPNQKMAAEGFLEQALGKLFAVAEAYPQLKADANFRQLQEELSHTENKVSFARQAYNDAVLAYNNAIEVFPGNVIASFGNRKEKQMLQVPVEARAVPKVAF